MIWKQVSAEDDGELAIVFFDELVDAGVYSGAEWALIVGKFKEENFGVWTAFDEIGDLAVVVGGADDAPKIIFFVFGGFVVAVDDEKCQNTKKRDGCYASNDSSDGKTFFHNNSFMLQLYHGL